MSKKLIVYKVLNNSAIMGDMDGFECIVIGKGIGFGKKVGDILDIDSRVEKIFKYQSVKNIEENKLKTLIADTFTSLNLVSNEELPNNKLILFIDHVITMYKRILNNECLDNPFAIETKVLYEESYNYAIKFGDTIYNKTKIQIPESELSFLTLHFQNMFIDKQHEDISALNKIVYLVKDLLSTKYNFIIENENIDYIRFLTHLKFLVHRIYNNKLLEGFSFSYECKDSVKNVSDDIINILQTELNTKVNEVERQLLNLHIIRFLKVY